MEGDILSFLLKSLYDVLPSPTNLGPIQESRLQTLWPPSGTPRPGKTCTEDSQQRPFTHNLCQSRARGQRSKKCEWNPRHCQWLETGSRPEEPTQISTRDHRYQPETRHGYVVTFNQTSILGWTDSTVGRENWGELRKKTHKVPGPQRELCWKRLEAWCFTVKVDCKEFPA